MKSEAIVHRWPGGSTSIAGGTRTEIKLSRPWQKDIEVPPAEQCPFCHLDPPDRECVNFPEHGMKMLSNIFTPYDVHKMIIPNRCYSKEELRKLGGWGAIKSAVHIAREIAGQWNELMLSVHVGPLAGQNVAHLHWHLHVPARTKTPKPLRHEWLKCFWDKTELAIMRENTRFCVGIGGVRAGQCIFVERPSNVVPAEDYDLRNIIWDCIVLGNHKWKSAQGLPPDYSIALRFVNGKFDYGLYTPILNHLGGADFMSQYNGSAVALPWPHEVTAEYLQKT